MASKPVRSVDLGKVPVAPLYSSTLVRLAAVFGAGMVLALAVAAGAALWAGRQETITAASRTSASLARALTDAVARSVNSIDVTLSFVADQAMEGGRMAGTSALIKPVAQRLALAPHVRQILVVRVDGTVLFDSAGQMDGKEMDLSAILEEFRRIPRSLVIGKPVAGRFIGGGKAAAGQSLIPMASAIRGGDGTITALVLAAINPEHFRSIFHEIEEDTGSRVRLWRFDGVLLAGDPLIPAFAGRGAELPLFTDHINVSEMGGFIGPDEDGVERITSYRTTLAWPLVVSVSLPVEVALGNWRRNALGLSWPVGLVILAVLGLTVLLVRSLARRARDEARLRLSERVLANVSNGVIIADARASDLPLLYVNRAFEDMTGYRADQALGRNARFLHDGHADQEGLERLREALAENGSVTVKLRNVRADGGLFWNQVSVSPVRNSSGVVTHWVGVLRDVSQEEEARAALAAAYDKVARYSADLERFSFVLAHHLQEPARQMRLQAQLLLHRGMERSDREDLVPAERIVDASARLVELLHDFQAYLEVEREPARGAEAASAAALNRAVAKCGEDYPDETIALIQGNLPRVAIPQRRLDELFLILVDNAVRFRKPDCPLELEVSAEPSETKGFWLFRVADNGIGIESQYFERIFIPLERLRLRQGPEGTGIGLAVARKIVESAHGQIRVDSDGTSGSTFLFTLPMAAE